MHARFAFTAEFWGDSAVICRATEDQPGPVVVQEFGEFESWTQAHTFAQRLNEGLELPPHEVEQILTSAILSADRLFHTLDSPKLCPAPLSGHFVRTDIQLQFTLVELDLALTFCRIVSCGSLRQKNRLVRNARNALFNAMHFMFHTDLPVSELLPVRAKVDELRDCLRQFPLLPSQVPQTDMETEAVS